MQSKQGRNKKCNCRSNKKYKQCCLINKINPIVQEYINLPLLPEDVEITIDKMGLYNYLGYGGSGDIVKYGEFTSADPITYPLGTNPKIDYMPSEGVSPIKITDINGVMYKVDDIMWFPLTDIYNGILIKQQQTGNRFFPQTIYIDKMVGNKLKWMSTLKNIIGWDIMLNLQTQY
jgi:hypothetical protein